jgi:hypothetical protein
MAQGSSKGTGGSDTAGYSPDDIENMEREALEKANKAIGSIENAMAVWNTVKNKTPDLQYRIDRLRRIYETLTAWERKSLRQMAKPEGPLAKIERLREFSDICYSLGQT